MLIYESVTVCIRLIFLKHRDAQKPVKRLGHALASRYCLCHYLYLFSTFEVASQDSLEVRNPLHVLDDCAAEPMARAHPVSAVTCKNFETCFIQARQAAFSWAATSHYRLLNPVC